MTRYFLDASALVKHYHTELGTDAVDRIIGEAGAELLIARLTLVETISVFAIKVRTGEFDVLEFARLRALFATHIARRRYQVFRLLNVHYVRARELIANHGLSDRFALSMPFSSASPFNSIRPPPSTISSAPTSGSARSRLVRGLPLSIPSFRNRLC